MRTRYLFACLFGVIIAGCSEADGAGQNVTEQPSLEGGSILPASDAGGDASSVPAPPNPGVDAGATNPQRDAAPAAALDASAPDASGNTPRSDAGAVPASDASAGGDAAVTPGGACDRACLLGFAQSYLDALIAHDPAKLKVSTNLKYTDNGVAAKLGEGLWKTASALVKEARLDFADPSAGQVTTQTVINESGSMPVIYMVRLKLVDGSITEIESMSVRKQGAANGFFDPAKLVPERVFLAPIDPAKRMTRDALNRVTELYLDYLEGKKKANELPFDMGCKRYENGVVTANGLSAFNAQNFWKFKVTRRTLIIDEEAGITWGMYPFDEGASPLVVGEAFKIVDGKIMMIQAVMARIPVAAWQ